MGVDTNRLVPRAEIETAWRLEGDPTGAVERFVYADAELVGTFTDEAALRGELARRDRARIDADGCRFLLAYGLVPPPVTAYRGLACLGPGDRFTVGRDRIEASIDFPFFEERSRQDVRSDPERLARLLTDAVDRAIAGRDAVLMQSAGKDSCGLLLAVAARGTRGVRAVTFEAGTGESEGASAASLAARFGVPHRVVYGDPGHECRLFLEFAARSPRVVSDVALFPYLAALERAGAAGSVVLDGLGNDAYMGYVEPARDRWLRRICLAARFPALWGVAEAPALGDRASYALKSLLMYPVERALAGSRPSPCRVRELLPGAGRFSGWAAALDRELRSRSPVDRRAFVRGRTFDFGMTMPKARLAAAFHGAAAVFPYCDRGVVEHCFHLPRADRYDLASATNKLELRKLLASRIGDAPYLATKGSFRYDVRRFVEVNDEVVARELVAAEEILPGVTKLGRFYRARRRNYVHAYMLTSLFMVAAWLRRRPGRELDALRSSRTRASEEAGDPRAESRVPVP